MKLLIFGKTGQVATELRHLAKAKGLEARFVDRAEADLSKTGSAAAVIDGSNADVVINATAYTAVDRAESEEGLAHQVNAIAPGEMAAACQAAGKHFLHISTDYVFPGTGSTPWTEADTPEPKSAYGRTKLAGEVAVAMAHPGAIILRTAWVFSAHSANFVKTMLRLGATREEVGVVADQLGGPTAARDIAEALLEIAAQKSVGATANGIYHFSGAPTVSWADFAEAIFAIAPGTKVNRITSAEFPTPVERPKNSALDCSRIAADFGIAQPDWRTGLKGVMAELEAKV